jgi:acyl dehydratase
MSDCDEFRKALVRNHAQVNHMTTISTAFTDRKATAESVGKQHISNWFHVTQKQLDAFSEATGDNQWIHRLNVKPGLSPFGGPIAHGLLVVSLAINLARDCGALPGGTWVLYGFDKLRFRTPVRSGSRIRCLTMIRDFHELGGRLLLSARFVVEVADGKIPALTMNCSLLCLNLDAKL